MWKLLCLFLLVWFGEGCSNVGRGCWKIGIGCWDYLLLRENLGNYW